MSKEIDFKALRAPFPEEDLEWRIQRGGMKNGKPWALCFCYVNARAVQNRLDDVCGPDGWRCEYAHLATGGVICRLSLKCGSEWITKEDGSQETDVEPFKGGISKSLVRTASVWGVGRYLYEREATFANFVPEGTPGALHAKIENQNFYWLPPGNPKTEPRAAAASPQEKTPVAPPSSGGKKALCEGCGLELRKSRDKPWYYCPNFKKTDVPHSTIKESEIDQHIANQDIPF